MNSAHLHLLVTHVPIFGSLFGMLLLLLSIWKGSAEFERTSCWILVWAGLLAVPTYLTGRPASQVLMKAMPGMSTDAGEQHAEVAVIALTVALVGSAVALLGLWAWRKTRKFPRWFTALLLALTLLTCATMVWTANLGGKIRHSEIQP